MSKIATISFSGGMDSTSLLLHLINQNYKVYALSFNYGQKHKLELDKATNNIYYLKSLGIKINHKIINDIRSSAVIANYNSKNQTIISGEKDEIDILIHILKKNKFRIIPLNVSGAFHSPLMNNVKNSLDYIINKSNFQNINIPIYQNYNPIKNFKSHVIKKNLMKQINSPVKWIDTINNMYSDGLSNFIEVGPGSVLSKLNKNINSDIICTNFNKL